MDNSRAVANQFMQAFKHTSLLMSAGMQNKGQSSTMRSIHRLYMLTCMQYLCKADLLTKKLGLASWLLETRLASRGTGNLADAAIRRPLNEDGCHL